MRDASRKIPPVVASDPSGNALVRILPTSGPSFSKELCKEKNACRCFSPRAAIFLALLSCMSFLEVPVRGTLNNGDSARMRVPFISFFAAIMPWPLPGISCIEYKRSPVSLWIFEMLVAASDIVQRWCSDEL